MYCVVILDVFFNFFIVSEMLFADCDAELMFILFAADDAEPPAGGRWSGPSGKRKPHGGHLL